VIVAVAVELVDGLLRVIAREEVDEREATRLVRLAVLGQVDALDGAKAAEELAQVRVLYVSERLDTRTVQLSSRSAICALREPSALRRLGGT